MKITTITATFGRTQNLGDYSNARPELSATAELDEGDDPEAARQQLLAFLRAGVNEEADQALEDACKPAKFSTEPRYRLAAVSEEIYVGDRWTGRTTVTAPEKLLVLTPQTISLHDKKRPGHVWWHAPYGPSEKLRLHHAYRTATAWLEDHDEGYRLIDCADGDLSRLPAWALEAPQAPEPAPQPAATEAAVWAPRDDDEDLER